MPFARDASFALSGFSLSVHWDLCSAAATLLRTADGWRIAVGLLRRRAKAAARPAVTLVSLTPVAIDAGRLFIQEPQIGVELAPVMPVLVVKESKVLSPGEISVL